MMVDIFLENRKLKIFAKMQSVGYELSKVKHGGFPKTATEKLAKFN